jgi:hypothetical protein
MKIVSENTFARSTDNVCIETRFKAYQSGQEMYPTVLVTVIVQNPSMNAVNDLSRVLCRRIEFALEETV